MRTYAVLVNGQQMAQDVTKALALASQWFTFEPQPDDDYQITVKAENKTLLDRLVVEATFNETAASPRT